MNPANQNFRFQQIIALTSVVLFVLKVVAWYLTQSVAILTDALESTINVISGFVGLYSLYLSAQPKDRNHPYGHGKVEFVSAAIEGTLISVAGLIIIYEAINNLRHPHTLGQLDTGILLVSVTAVINYVLGFLAVRMGKKNNSLALTASGKHLQSDTYSTLGIIAGLVLLYVTHLAWIDSAVAFLFAFLIMFTGYKIVRGSLAGIMDEADEALLDSLVTQLQAARRSNWIDLHNLRIIKYGSTLHLDC
ncbi:MAG: cation transporter, partial [Bacteroidetes bacterium]